MNTDKISMIILDELAGHFETLPLLDALQITESMTARLMKETYPRYIVDGAKLDIELDIPEHLQAGKLIPVPHGQSYDEALADHRKAQDEPKKSNDDGEEHGLRDMAGTEESPPRPLTDKQTEVLDMVIALHSESPEVTLTAIAEALDTHPANITHIPKRLCELGYMKRTKKLYRALKNPDGTKYRSSAPVTQCPPAYAAGYADIKIGS